MWGRWWVFGVVAQKFYKHLILRTYMLRKKGVSHSTSRINIPYKILGAKRSLSPVIASVLLIALVLVLAAIIFLWARGFISEQIEKFGQPINTLCEQVSIEADLIIQGGVGNELEIANRGNVDIHSFDIKVISNGDSTIQKFAISVDVGKAVKESLALSLLDADKIVIYPALLGNVKDKKTNKVYTCVEQGKTINL